MNSELIGNETGLSSAAFGGAEADDREENGVGVEDLTPFFSLQISAA